MLYCVVDNGGLKSVQGASCVYFRTLSCPTNVINNSEYTGSNIEAASFTASLYSPPVSTLYRSPNTYSNGILNP